MNHYLRSLQLTFYLIPIFGIIPAGWSLYRQTGTPQKLAVSRLSLMLAFSWIIAYTLLGAGTHLTASTVWSVRFLYLDGLITSGYFVSCFVLLIQLWRGKTPKLPGISQLANQILRSDTA